MKRMAKVLAYVLSASMVMQTPVNVVQAAEADDISSTTIVADLTSEDAAIIEDGEENGEPEVAPIAAPVGEIGEPETEPAPEADPEPETEPIAPVVEPTAAPVVDPIEEPEKEIETPDPEETIIVIDDPEFEVDAANFGYDLNSDEMAIINSYTGTAAALVIPSTLDGYPVVKIDSSVFRNHTEITSVTMPDTITSIENYAFAGCTNLKTITFSEGLTFLGYQSFKDCTSLNNIVIPALLEECGSYYGGPFVGCTGLKKVTLASGMEKVADNLFLDCPGLETITIPASVKEIHENAFRSCSNLKEVVFSSGLETIGHSAFSNCDSLVSITMPDTVTSIGNYAFDGCELLSEVNLSENLLSMGYQAFSDCPSLTAIVIPAKLEECGSYYGGPFVGSDNLKNVTLAEGLAVVPGHLFDSCNGPEVIVIPDTVTEIGNGAFVSCKNLTTVTLSKNLVTIESGAFQNCEKLAAINMPNTVLRVDTYAFQNCSLLAEVNLSENLEFLGYHAFGNCTKLTGIVIPTKLEECSTYYGGPFTGCKNLKNVKLAEGLTRVANGIFEQCSGIETIVIPDTVTEIKAAAFSECANLKSVVFSKNLTWIHSYAFDKCPGLTSVDLSDTVVLKIDEYAFQNDTNLVDVKLPQSLTHLSYHAFGECPKIESISIPARLEEVGSHYGGPFANDTGLKNIIFEGERTKIPNGLFSYCSGLEKIVIPDTVQEIGDHAFEKCTALTSIEIPNSVSVIGQYAFEECSALPSIKLPSGMKTIKQGLFEKCTSLANVSLPKNLERIEDYAFYSCSALTDIQLPSTLTYMGQACFRESGLTAIDIPNTVTDLSRYAFLNCPALVDVNIGKSVPAINAETFKGCKLIEKLVIPDSVKTIASNAFDGCESLKQIRIGTGVTEIYNSTFKDMKSLTTVYFSNRLKKIGEQAFVNDVYLTEIYIPQSVTSIAENAFSYPSRLVIYGVTDSYAQGYAKTIGATFVAREIHIESIVPESNEITIDKGSKYTIPITVTPIDHTDILTWKTTDTAIVTVDDTGCVTAHAVGTATIKVTGDFVSASIKVHVVQPMTSINLNKTSISLDGGESEQLVATPYPAGSYDSDIIWYSEDPEIADVDQNGKVTAYLQGQTRIIAAAASGSGVTRACTVTVNNTCKKVNKLSDFTSLHPYKNNCSDKWRLDIPGATSIAITFDARTSVEEDCDFIKISDGAGNEIGTYTGTELAGQRIVIGDGSVIVQLITDEGGLGWGFAVTEIEQVSPEAESLLILDQPTSVLAEENEDVTFHVSAKGTGVSYHWQSSTDGNNWTDLTKTQGAVENILEMTATMSKDGLYIRCNVEDIFGNVQTSDIVRLSINIPLAITTQPKSITVQAGEVAKFSVVATGKSLQYAWTYSTDNGATWKTSTSASASTATFSITAAEKWNGMLLRCTVTDSDGNSAITSTAKLTVPITSKPVITGQPVSATVNEGEKASFTVTATGTGLTYQWYYSTDNGTTFQKSTASSATTKTFSITSAAKWNGMQLKCVVTNAGGVSVTTNTVKLNVKLALAITAQPKSVTANVGDKANFTVTAVGDGVTYQWYSSTDNGATYVKSTATCATTKTFSITAAEKWNGLLLKCVVKDASGAKLTTSAAKLTVVSPLAITTQPKSVTANVGDKATFTVAATGTGLTYQWYSCTDGTTYVKSTASCATTNTFTITAATKWNGMQLKCVVRDANGGKITTAAAKLTVVEPLAITAQPKSVTANIGDKASFTVTATGTGLTYQWYSSTDNGATYVKSTATCATTKTFSITAAEKWNGLLLKCVVRDANGGKLTTAAAKLTVNSPLAITAQPKSVTANVGDKASFTVTATGTGLTYQWYSSTDNGATYVKSTATCATTKTFSITAAEKWNGLLLKCVVKDANGGKLTTAAAKLTVAPAFAITAQPKSVAAAAGDKASFTVTATGNGLTYQWYYSTDNGATYVKSTATCATTKTFSITAAAKWNGMLLKCVVKDANGGKLTTSAAKLTVATAPTITGQPQNSITVAGAKAEFKVTATGDITGYQWYYSMDDGATWVKSTAACATTNTFSITAAAKWNYMMLKCEVIGQGGTKTTSNFAMLIVR